MIRAKDFFEELIKGVFGFWSFSVGATKPEDVGRTYFYDHRNEEAPFTADCIGKIRILYEYTFQYKLDVDPTDISSNLCALIKEHFGTDFSYLIFRDDDTPELSNAKRNFWEQIMEKLYTHLNRKKNIDEKVISYTREDKTARQDIERLAKGTKTEGYLKALEENKSSTSDTRVIKSPERIIQDNFSSNLSFMRMIEKHQVIDTSYTGQNKGGCLFFLETPYLDLDIFLTSYRKNTIYESVAPLPQTLTRLRPNQENVDEIKRIWDENVRKGDILPTTEKQSILQGYDIRSAKQLISEYENILYVKGDANLYKSIIGHGITLNVAVIILLPFTCRELFGFDEEETRVTIGDLLEFNCSGEDKKEEILEYNNSLDFFINNNIPGVHAFRWNPDDEETNNVHNVAYISGSIDQILSIWHPKTYKDNAVLEIRNCIRAGLNYMYGFDG